MLLASSLIPGNEKSVYKVMNGLMKLGANVVHKGNAMVHVSGHASAGELLYCYNIVRPKNVMPIHGEWRHLVANGKLVREGTVGELRGNATSLVRTSVEAGTLDSGTGRLVARSLGFGEQTAADVMTPRNRASSIDRTASAEELAAPRR